MSILNAFTWFGPLVIRKERWGLSWRGRLLVAAVVLLSGVLFLKGVHPFLAVTHREQANVLVVEGWVSHYGIDAAIQEWKAGHYDRVFTTGGPLEGAGDSTSIYNTEAYQSAELLIKAGMPTERVQSVPALYVGRDRTYNSALVLRKWLNENDMQLKSFNVMTMDAHARRTWLLFQEAFGQSARIGIISIANPDFDANHWWRTSEGTREVIGETIAYIYARFFFWPK